MQLRAANSLRYQRPVKTGWSGFASVVRVPKSIHAAGAAGLLSDD
jgi:hypothetical protein